MGIILWEGKESLESSRNNLPFIVFFRILPSNSGTNLGLLIEIGKVNTNIITSQKQIYVINPYAFYSSLSILQSFVIEEITNFIKIDIIYVHFYICIHVLAYNIVL